MEHTLDRTQAQHRRTFQRFNRSARPLGRLRAIFIGRPGPNTARWFHGAYATVALAAWLSLASQVDILISSRGLLPIRAHLTVLRSTTGLGFWDMPTLAWWFSSDTAL